MRKLFISLALLGLLGAVMATPVAATTTRIPTSCVSERQTEWTVPRQWVDADLVLHIRGESAVYREIGDAYCAGTNEVTVDVNLDLTTGEGTVTGWAHITLDAFDGGLDQRLVAHLTPGGPYIWTGMLVGNGFGELTGWQFRADIVEDTHEIAHYTGFIFAPGS